MARGGWLRSALWLLRERLVNLQSPARSTQVVLRHYYLAPQMYLAMLDLWLLYSCGTWQRASTLEEAQEHKLRLICEKLELRPGLRRLDIGYGWGGLAAYAAAHYGVEVVGITLSPERLRSVAQDPIRGPHRSILSRVRCIALFDVDDPRRVDEPHADTD
ncbi:MAG: class I SAM-dependent methyltransferase [Cyanobium sp.]